MLLFLPDYYLRIHPNADHDMQPAAERHAGPSYATGTMRRFSGRHIANQRDAQSQNVSWHVLV
jgi:hypothetical protein